MAKAHLAIDNEDRQVVAFHCPGCKCAHCIPVRAKSGPTWTWNGSTDQPTFSPSIFYTDPGYRCHSFVTDGHIQFLGDSDHSLAGQTVELPEWEGF